jgi:hypothetical protein
MTSHNHAEPINKLGESVLDTAKKITEINVETGEKLLGQHNELTRNFITATTRSAEILGKAKSYSELLGAQSEIAQEYLQHVAAGYRSTAEILTEAGKSFAGIVDQAASKPREKVGRAA